MNTTQTRYFMTLAHTLNYSAAAEMADGTDQGVFRRLSGGGTVFLPDGYLLHPHGSYGKDRGLGRNEI